MASAVVDAIWDASGECVVVGVGVAEEGGVGRGLERWMGEMVGMGGFWGLERVMMGGGVGGGFLFFGGFFGLGCFADGVGVERALVEEAADVGEDAFGEGGVRAGGELGGGVALGEGFGADVEWDSDEAGGGAELVLAVDEVGGLMVVVVGGYVGREFAGAEVHGCGAG